jgi:hypothetical protein
LRCHHRNPVIGTPPGRLKRCRDRASAGAAQPLAKACPKRLGPWQLGANALLFERGRHTGGVIDVSSG